MGYTPAGGLMMGSRPGDLDPGVSWYMMRSENLSPEQFNNIINHESGLLGVSETSSDMHDLLVNQNIDFRAAEAVELYCYQVRKWIGAFAAALGGLDTLVFSGGIGENATEVRKRVCEGLGFIGIEIDEKQNNSNAQVISKNISDTAVYVIHTDEEWMIAKTVSKMINLT
jgi:acetate kinase